MRDGYLRYLPRNLLVTGDLILLAFGDVCPAKVQYVPNSQSDWDENEEIILQQDTLLKPNCFTVFSKYSSFTSHIKNIDGHHRFIMLETPLLHTLNTILPPSRPKNVVSNQLQVLANIIYEKLLWIVLGSSFMVNLIRYLVHDAPMGRINQVLEMLLPLQVYAVLPLLPLAFPLTILAFRTYGNAQLLSLFDALQGSKTEYEDREDVDEFDAAPPPTKDISLSFRKDCFFLFFFFVVVVVN